jgi:hypothetical protein
MLLYITKIYPLNRPFVSHLLSIPIFFFPFPPLPFGLLFPNTHLLGEFSGTFEISTSPRPAFFLPTGKLALEMMEEMSRAENIDGGGFCGTLLLAAWLRANNAPIASEIGPVNSPDLAFGTIA